MAQLEREPVLDDVLLGIEEDEIVGYKHVFQTQITRTTTNERIRSPMGMFTRAETFIDNDAALLMRHLGEYYS